MQNNLLSFQTKDQNGSKTLTTRLDDWTPNNESQLVSLVNRQKATVLYFSIADNNLYSWLVVPTRGIIKFHQTELPTNEDGDSILGMISNKMWIATNFCHKHFKYSFEAIY